MRIFNLQGLGAPDKPKKKIKHAEIDFTSHHSFLNLRKVKKINLKLSHSKKIQPTDHSTNATLVAGAFTISHTKCQKRVFLEEVWGPFCMDGHRGLLIPVCFW
jgi:hypothetical protein